MKQKGINLATNDFERDITEIINTSGLPAINVRFVLSKLLDEVTDIENDLIEKERLEYEKEDSSNEVS